MQSFTFPFQLPSVGSRKRRSRRLEMDWEGGDLSSEGGIQLLSAADQKLKLTEHLAAATKDRREQGRVRHSHLALFRQRIYQICLGYSDANDANTLRNDPLFKETIGWGPDREPLATQSTISRWENAARKVDIRGLRDAQMDCFLDRVRSSAREIIIDIDPFDDPCHGAQQGSLFNDYYKVRCYLPLQVVASIDGGRQWVVGAVLRPGNAGAARLAIPYLRELVDEIRKRAPEARIIIRGDSAYGNDRMIRACESMHAQYCFALIPNAVLLRLAGAARGAAASAEALRIRRPKDARREARCTSYRDFQYAAGTWRCLNRVVVRCEAGKPARFYVTDLPSHSEVKQLQTGKPQEAGEGRESEKPWSAHEVFRFYCARGDRENRIREFKCDLDAGRLSCHGYRANEFRLAMMVAAYALLQEIQEQLARISAVKRLANLQVSTVRSMLLKVAVLVRWSRRRVRLSFASHYPLKDVWMRVLAGLLPAPAT